MSGPPTAPPKTPSKLAELIHLLNEKMAHLESQLSEQEQARVEWKKSVLGKVDQTRAEIIAGVQDSIADKAKLAAKEEAEEAAETARAAMALAERAAADIESRSATLKAGLDEAIANKLRDSFVVAGLALTIVGGLGYVGAKSLVENTVARAVDSNVNNELSTILTAARNHASEIGTIRSSSLSGLRIVLQTDHGMESPYTGMIIGSIYREDPVARISVVATEVNEFDVRHAAWLLARYARFFPAQTVFVSVVNPGGDTSDPIALKTTNGMWFVGHNNGTFDFVVADLGAQQVIQLAGTLNDTRDDLFGGAGVLGPAAARIARGDDAASLGRALQAYTPRLRVPVLNVSESRITCTVMDIDRFGNVTTNAPASALRDIGVDLNGLMSVKAGPSRPSRIQYVGTYGHVSSGQSVVVIYDGLVQLAVNMGSFAESHHVTRGDIVTLDVGH